MESCDQVGQGAGRQLCICVGVHVKARVHAEIGACVFGFLGCWVARSPGFLCSWVAMVTLVQDKNEGIRQESVTTRGVFNQF